MQALGSEGGHCGVECEKSCYALRTASSSDTIFADYTCWGEEVASGDAKL